ncbi:MAG: universal stress protein [Myxococcales bacterium]|nr:universal stress protein [Myxococcales bacterium]
MTNVDQFESVFRSADKPVFHFARVELRKVLVVTDLATQAAEGFGRAVRRFLHGLHARGLAWETVDGGEFSSQGELLERVVRAEPQLVCTYRHLHSDGWRWRHSLGEYLDVLTQVYDAPVLVCPHPECMEPDRFAERGTDRVMAVTDHLAGDDRLVNWAVELTEDDGVLLLTHVEDEPAYARMIDVIGKIPALDTDVARRTIKPQLLKEPHDYIRSCRERLEAAGARVKVEEIVTMGHRLADYKRLVAEHEVDVLVLNTRDEDQLAMHGLAYPLAVELRDIPLLLL